MEDVSVARLMSTILHTVTSDTPVEDVAQLILDNNIGSVTVVDEDNRPRGILTTTDFVDIIAKSQPKAQTTVERYVTVDAVTAGTQDSIPSVAESMTEHGSHHMPVVNEEEGAIGMIAISDLAVYPSWTGQSARSQRRRFRLASTLLHLFGEAPDYARQPRVRHVVVVDREGRDVHFVVDHRVAVVPDRTAVAVFAIEQERILEVDGVRSRNVLQPDVHLVAVEVVLAVAVWERAGVRAVVDLLVVVREGTGHAHSGARHARRGVDVQEANLVEHVGPEDVLGQGTGDPCGTKEVVLLGRVTEEVPGVVAGDGDGGYSEERGLDARIDGSRPADDVVACVRAVVNTGDDDIEVGVEVAKGVGDAVRGGSFESVPPRVVAADHVFIAGAADAALILGGCGDGHVADSGESLAHGGDAGRVDAVVVGEEDSK